MIIFQFKWQQDRDYFLILISMKFNLQFFLSAGCRAWSGRSGGGMGLIVQVSDLPCPTLPPHSHLRPQNFSFANCLVLLFVHLDTYISPQWQIYLPTLIDIYTPNATNAYISTMEKMLRKPAENVWKHFKVFQKDFRPQAVLPCIAHYNGKNGPEFYDTSCERTHVLWWWQQ